MSVVVMSLRSVVVMWSVSLRSRLWFVRRRFVIVSLGRSGSVRSMSVSFVR